MCLGVFIIGPGLAGFVIAFEMLRAQILTFLVNEPQLKQLMTILFIPFTDNGADDARDTRFCHLRLFFEPYLHNIDAICYRRRSMLRYFRRNCHFMFNQTTTENSDLSLFHCPFTADQ